MGEGGGGGGGGVKVIIGTRMIDVRDDWSLVTPGRRQSSSAAPLGWAWPQ